MARKEVTIHSGRNKPPSYKWLVTLCVNCCHCALPSAFLASQVSSYPFLSFSSSQSTDFFYSMYKKKFSPILTFSHMSLSPSPILNFSFLWQLSVFEKGLLSIHVFISYSFSMNCHLAPPTSHPDYKVWASAPTLSIRMVTEGFPHIHSAPRELLNLVLSLGPKCIIFSPFLHLLLVPSHFSIELPKCPPNSPPFHIKQF